MISFIRGYVYLIPQLALDTQKFLYCIKNAEQYNKGNIKDPSKVGIKAISDTILEVTLRQPTPYFPEIASFYVTMPTPKEAVKKYGRNWIKEGKIVCNGPFRLKDWQLHHRIVVEKNPYYWGRKTVKLKEAIFLPIENAASALNLYRAGTVDVVFEIPIELTPFIRKRKDWHAHPGWGTYYYKLNTQRGVLKKKLVRQALSQSIDRQAIVDFLKGGQKAAYSFTPPYIKGYIPPKGLGFNPISSKKEISFGWIPWGKRFPQTCYSVQYI